jgi:hypothetical protein
MLLDKIRKATSLRALAFIAALLMCQPSFGYTSADKTPSGIAMTADLIIGRPALLAMTAVGAAVWLVSLPIAVLGGNAEQTGQTLVVDPARATFVRCLGCSSTQYKE